LNKKALFKGVAITLLVACLALLFSSAKVIGMAIKFAIESADKELLGVEITIKKVALNLFAGYVHVQRLVVHQPEEEIVYTKSADGKLVGTPTGKMCVWKNDYLAKVDLVLIKINVHRILMTLGKEFELENLSVKGIHVNIEKPDTNLKAENANIQYIINHLGALGLVPPPEAEPDAATKKAQEEKAAKEAEEATNKAEEDAKKKAEAPEEKPAADFDIPEIIIHKICFGDIGAGVVISGVRFIGEISFHPNIGLFEIDDVKQQVFGGRDNKDLTPGEMVACVINATMKHVFESVVHELPKQIAAAASGAASAAASGVKTSMDKAFKKIPCNA
jgi:hypothetical protein